MGNTTSAKPSQFESQGSRIGDWRPKSNYLEIWNTEDVSTWAIASQNAISDAELVSNNIDGDGVLTLGRRWAFCVRSGAPATFKAFYILRKTCMEEGLWAEQRKEEAKLERFPVRIGIPSPSHRHKVLKYFHLETEEGIGTVSRAYRRQWSSQPRPFRRFYGAPLIPLEVSKAQSCSSPPYPDLFSGRELPVRALSLEALSLLLFNSLAPSFSRRGSAMEYLKRVNPSSGCLHPVEAYCVVPPALTPLTAGAAALLHYAPSSHGLELRARYDADTWRRLSAAVASAVGGQRGAGPPRRCRWFLCCVTTVDWRETWKYGERGYRYAQLDLGHAAAALWLAARAQGWALHWLNGVSDEVMDALLGQRGHYAGIPEGERETAALLGVVVVGEGGGEGEGGGGGGEDSNSGDTEGKGGDAIAASAPAVASAEAEETEEAAAPPPSSSSSSSSSSSGLLLPLPPQLKWPPPPLLQQSGQGCVPTTFYGTPNRMSGVHTSWRLVDAARAAGTRQRNCPSPLLGAITPDPVLLPPLPPHPPSLGEQGGSAGDVQSAACRGWPSSSYVARSRRSSHQFSAAAATAEQLEALLHGVLFGALLARPFLTPPADATAGAPTAVGGCDDPSAAAASGDGCGTGGCSGLVLSVHVLRVEGMETGVYALPLCHCTPPVSAPGGDAPAAPSLLSRLVRVEGVSLDNMETLMHNTSCQQRLVSKSAVTFGIFSSLSFLETPAAEVQQTSSELKEGEAEAGEAEAGEAEAGEEGQAGGEEGAVVGEDGSAYRRRFWAAGVIGHLIYTHATAMGLGTTGLGCFLDDVAGATLRPLTVCCNPSGAAESDDDTGNGNGDGAEEEEEEAAAGAQFRSLVYPQSGAAVLKPLYHITVGVHEALIGYGASEDVAGGSAPLASAAEQSDDEPDAGGEQGSFAYSLDPSRAAAPLLGFHTSKYLVAATQAHAAAVEAAAHSDAFSVSMGHCGHACECTGGGPLRSTWVTDRSAPALPWQWVCDHCLNHCPLPNTFPPDNAAAQIAHQTANLGVATAAPPAVLDNAAVTMPVLPVSTLKPPPAAPTAAPALAAMEDNALCASMRLHGFAFLRNDSAALRPLLSRLRHLTEQFFALPAAEKGRYSTDAFTGVGANLGYVCVPDVREYFRFRHSDPAHLFPSSPPGFHDTFMRALRAMFRDVAWPCFLHLARSGRSQTRQQLLRAFDRATAAGAVGSGKRVVGAAAAAAATAAGGESTERLLTEAQVEAIAEFALDKSSFNLIHYPGDEGSGDGDVAVAGGDNAAPATQDAVSSGEEGEEETKDGTVSPTPAATDAAAASAAAAGTRCVCETHEDTGLLTFGIASEVPALQMYDAHRRAFVCAEELVAPGSICAFIGKKLPMFAATDVAVAPPAPAPAPTGWRALLPGSTAAKNREAADNIHYRASPHRVVVRGSPRRYAIVFLLDVAK